ncbi:MAG TPA: hypothetical protein VKB96_02795 [Gammaproteobacteria bacterium]|nr:hypothetical protein [Gammaproteobacteria bacterium]
MTKQPFTMDDPCVERGPHFGYNAAATTAVTEAVKDFFRETLKLDGDNKTKPARKSPT